MRRTCELRGYDLVAISQWAGQTWCLARSLASGVPVRPEMEGGTLRVELLPHHLRALCDHFTLYEATGAAITLYAWEGSGIQTRRHRTTWAQVASWLTTWSERDRLAVIDLERRERDLWERPDEVVKPYDTGAVREAKRARREARLYGPGGDIAVYRAAEEAVGVLVTRHLTASQLALF